MLGAVLLFAYRSYEGARQRSESLERVNRFTELVGREVELDAVVRTVLTEVRSSFEVGAVHLRLTHDDGTLQDWCLDGETLSVGSSALVDAVAGLAADGTARRPTPYARPAPAGGPRAGPGQRLRPGSPSQ